MIIGVAIRNDNMVISLPKPNRHSDCFAYAKRLGINLSESELGKKADHQGFITHTGKFLNRVETAKYLKRIKQPTIVKIGKVAISEDLW